MRLIDADRLYMQFEKRMAFEKHRNHAYLKGVRDCMKDVEQMPTINPERAIKDCRNCKHGNYNDHWGTYFCYYSGDCNNWDKWEPSARPEHKKGKWELHTDERFDIDYYKCSECGYEPYRKMDISNFCPNCGCQMEEGEK